MLDKIKAFLESAKNVILFVVGPIVAVVGYILYLRNENSDLKNKEATEKATVALAPIMADKEVKENEANDKVLNYNALRDQYIAQQLGTSGPDETKPKS